MRFILLAFAALLALAPPARAESITPEEAVAACNSYPDVPINVTPVFETPVYDYTANIPMLKQLSNDASHGIREGIPLGLTHYHPILEVANTTKVIDMPDGTTCAVVDHVDVTIGYKDVTVYIANEIPPNTCGFNEVMLHEQKHINVNLEVLNEYAPMIQQQLQEYLKANGVFREANYGYAVSLVHDHMKDIVTAIGQRLSDDNQQRQQRVDSPEEYHRISVSCNGQIQGIVGRYFHNGQ